MTMKFSNPNQLRHYQKGRKTVWEGTTAVLADLKDEISQTVRGKRKERQRKGERRKKKEKEARQGGNDK
jgi:hypothetical protein